MIVAQLVRNWEPACLPEHQLCTVSNCMQNFVIKQENKEFVDHSVRRGAKCLLCLLFLRDKGSKENYNLKQFFFFWPIELLLSSRKQQWFATTSNQLFCSSTEQQSESEYEHATNPEKLSFRLMVKTHQSEFWGNICHISVSTMKPSHNLGARNKRVQPNSEPGTLCFEVGGESYEWNQNVGMHDSLEK